ncbi:hypothetical protein BD408DRAFT_422443 [Parasitella parasitica]|nr:hypothetical protein BD408DRAFT_422443 [Parasitella parasitica]
MNTHFKVPVCQYKPIFLPVRFCIIYLLFFFNQMFCSLNIVLLTASSLIKCFTRAFIFLWLYLIRNMSSMSRLYLIVFSCLPFNLSIRISIRFTC